MTQTPTSMRVFLAAVAMMLALLLQPLSSWAHEGHDHGDQPATAAGPMSPRVTSHSDLFELVGVVDAGEIVIYLDRYATNEPVVGARIEVEAGTAKGIAEPQPDGTYHFKADVFAKPGSIPVSFTVQTGNDTDILAGDLKIGDPNESAAQEPAAPVWWRWALLAVGALVAVAAAAWSLRGRRVRRAALAWMACSALAVSAGMPSDASAHEGHNHGEEPAAAGGNGPRRQADGSVFLPKTTQRQLAVRTLVAEEASLPRSIELTGRVVADPNAGGKVQAMQAGRVEAGPRGLPQLGQAVRKGEVLAVVRPALGALERANQQAQAAELRSSLELAQRRVARLEQLEGTVPAKEIEAARAEVVSLQQRAKAVGGSLSAAESLVAPVTGVIAAANVVAGQVVDAREVLFEIVDPQRLGVEASAFDAAILNDIAGATASTGAGSAVPLRYVGAGRTLREGAIPLQFRTEPGSQPIPLAVGQPVKVTIQTRQQLKGVAVPAASVVKSPSNQDMVWVHTGAEVFEPRTVRVVPLDGATVSVVDGLKPGDRVVTQGAPLVNQVR